MHAGGEAAAAHRYENGVERLGGVVDLAVELASRSDFAGRVIGNEDVHRRGVAGQGQLADQRSLALNQIDQTFARQNLQRLA